MPYKNVSDIPDYVKKYSKDIQKRWKAIFNSVLKQTGDEKRAFKAANAILKKGKEKSYWDNENNMNFRAELATHETAQIDTILSSFGIRRHPHMMYLAFKLLHFDTPNNNGCIVPLEEAREKAWSVRNVPIDWEHEVSSKKSFFRFINKDKEVGIIGTVIAEKVIEPNKISEDEQILYQVEEDENSFLFTIGAIYKAKYKEDAEQIVGRFTNNELKFSMECRFTHLECPECGKIIGVGRDSKDVPCEHLESFFFFHSQNAKNKENKNNKEDLDFELREAADKILISNEEKIIQPYRLKNYYFTGSSIVEFPADEKAHGIALGADKNKMLEKKQNDKENGGVKLMYKEFETEAAFEKEIDLHVKNAVRAAEDKIKKSKDEEISTIKDQLKLHENKIKELTQKLEEVEKERDEANEKYDNYKHEVETAKILEQRIEKLASIGYEIDEEDSDYRQMISELSDEKFDVFYERQKKFVETSSNKEVENNEDNLPDMTEGDASSLKGSKEKAEEEDASEENASDKELSKEEKLSIALDKFIKRRQSE